MKITNKRAYSSKGFAYFLGKLKNYKVQILNTKILTSFAGKIFRLEAISESRKLCLSFKGKGILRENR